MTGLLLASNPLDHVVQHTVYGFNLDGGVLSFPIVSNHIIMQVLAAVLVVLILPWALRKRAGSDEIGRLVPRGIGNAIEGLCQTLRDRFFQPNLGDYTDRFTPYLWSIFFFIFACNILGMVPLSDLFSAEVFHHQIGGTATGNLYVTGALAFCTLVMVVYNGLRFHGMAYVKHFFMGPWYLAWFVAILEIAGLGFKAMALAVRLFANMLAGHILLAVLLGFIAPVYETSVVAGSLVGVGVIIASILVYFLEIFVAFLHAFIFTMLTAVFIGLAVNIHHEEHNEEHGHAEAAAGH